MKAGAELFISTDVPDLFDAMHETIDADFRFKALSDHEFWTFYTTHWDQFSQKDGRVLNRMAYRVVNPGL
jgi:hypothetical protein